MMQIVFHKKWRGNFCVIEENDQTLVVTPWLYKTDKKYTVLKSDVTIGFQSVIIICDSCGKRYKICESDLQRKGFTFSKRVLNKGIYCRCKECSERLTDCDATIEDTF